MTYETARAIFEFVDLVLIIFILFRMGQMYGGYCDAVMKAEKALECADKPDLMEQALLNIAMRKMQLQLRELMAYSEPNEMHELLCEYMRLRDEQDKKETQ